MVAAVLGVAVIIGCVCGLIILSTAADDDNIISIGEIYDNPTNVQKLYNALAGDGATYNQIKTLAEQTKNAADFRTLNDGRDVKVVFGGYTWHACYLSQTNETNPRPILTLWLEQPFTTSKFNQYSVYGNPQYPSDLYATSYIRALLNNGGTYATSGTSLADYTPNPNYALKEFLPDGRYGNLLVPPRCVDWQRYQSENKDRHNIGWDSGNTLYDGWQNDPLWLVCMATERALWSAEQIASSTDRVWARDGDHWFDRRQYVMLNKTNRFGTYTDNEVIWDEGVRPALHLDLSAPELTVYPTLHHITIIGDVSGNREQLSINFYSTRTEVIPDLPTFIQLLNDPNSGVFVVVNGSKVRYNEPGQGWREYPVTAVVPSSTANTFGYCYLNDEGNTVTVWRNLTERIEIADSVMGNPDAV